MEAEIRKEERSRREARNLELRDENAALEDLKPLFASIEKQLEHLDIETTAMTELHDRQMKYLNDKGHCNIQHQMYDAHSRGKTTHTVFGIFTRGFCAWCERVCQRTGTDSYIMLKSRKRDQIVPTNWPSRDLKPDGSLDYPLPVRVHRLKKDAIGAETKQNIIAKSSHLVAQTELALANSHSFSSVACSPSSMEKGRPQWKALQQLRGGISYETGIKTFRYCTSNGDPLEAEYVYWCKGTSNNADTCRCSTPMAMLKMQMLLEKKRCKPVCGLREHGFLIPYSSSGECKHTDKYFPQKNFDVPKK